MRKRNVQILFRLTEEEAEHLNELVRKSGRSKEAFLREMVRGYQLCEKPDPEFYKMMRELSAIGNRINQLAVKANALGFVDTPMLREETRKWNKLQTGLIITKCLYFCTRHRLSLIDRRNMNSRVCFHRKW